MILGRKTNKFTSKNLKKCYNKVIEENNLILPVYLQQILPVISYIKII